MTGFRRFPNGGWAVASCLLVLGAAWASLFGSEWLAARADLHQLELQAVGTRPSEPVLYHLATRLRSAGRPVESYAALAQAERLHPKSDRVRIARVRLLEELGRWAEADAAIAGWRPAVQSNPEGLYLRARLELTHRSRPRQALELLKPLRVHSPRPEVEYLAGQAHAALYQAEPSLLAFRKAVDTDPTQFRHHRELAQSYLYFGRLQDATQALREALSLAPNDATTLYLLGACLSMTARSLDEESSARELLKRAVALGPGDSEVHCQLGQSLQNSRLFGQAIPHYDLSLRIDPSHWDALYRLGQCRLQLGDGVRGEAMMRAHSQLRLLTEGPRSGPALAPRATTLTAEKWKQAASIYRQGGMRDLSRRSAEMAENSPPPSAAMSDSKRDR